MIFWIRHGGYRVLLPTLGIVFSSPAVGIEDLAKDLSLTRYPVFGCSTDGEIANIDPASPVLQQSVVCCLLDIPPHAFAIEVFEKKNDSSFILGQNIGHWGKQKFDQPAFVVGVGGLTMDGEAIVRRDAVHASKRDPDHRRDGRG